MVPRTPGKQIIFGLIVIGLITVSSLLILSPRSSNSPVYSATEDSLDLEVIRGIVAADKIYSKEEAVKAVVVPHHLVASESIALGIKALASSTHKKIIVISPDHYNLCPKLLCTTKGSYKTFFGDIIISDKDAVQLEKSSDLIAYSNLFKEEHGIYSIIPFIKYYIPESQIIPIAISQQGLGTEQNRSEALKILKSLLVQKDVALVISSDFSHYLPLSESNRMDTKTQNSFCSGNSQEILNLQNPSQSDCPLCLWILEQEAKELGFWNPHLMTHTNSAELLGDLSAKETTSHFTLTFSKSLLSTDCKISQ